MSLAEVLLIVLILLVLAALALLAVLLRSRNDGSSMRNTFKR